MKKNLLYILSLGFILVFSSCKKDKEEPAPSGGTEDIIATASRQVKDDIVSWTSTGGADAVIGLADVLNANSDPISTPRMASSEDYNKMGQIYKRKAQAFRKIFLPTGSTKFRNTAGDESFDFTANAGTYTFVRADSTWDFDGTITNQIIINFPSDTTSDVNDAKVTIFNYTETTYDNGTDITYLPTLIDAELTIGATKYVDVNFTATYTNDVPATLNYTLYLKPFTNTLSYSDGGASVTIAGSVAKDGEGSNIISNFATVDFYDASKDSVIKVTGYTQYRRIKLDGFINIAAIEAEDDATMGNVSVAFYNDNVDIDIIDNTNSQVVGHLEFFDNGTDVDIQVRFPDNTTKLASVYFDPILDELETFSTSVQ